MTEKKHCVKQIKYNKSSNQFIIYLDKQYMKDLDLKEGDFVKIEKVD